MASLGGLRVAKLKFLGCLPHICTIALYCCANNRLIQMLSIVFARYLSLHNTNDDRLEHRTGSNGRSVTKVY